MNIPNQNHILRTERTWPARSRLGINPSASGASLDFRSLRGKTAGLLGYGHIARETARLLQAFGVEVLAANTRGEKSVDEGVGLVLALLIDVASGHISPFGGRWGGCNGGDVPCLVPLLLGSEGYTRSTNWGGRGGEKATMTEGIAVPDVDL